MRDAKLENFLANTPAMRGLAYRMTGSASEPDDIVQEAWLRWQAATGDIANPRSYLLAIVANLCLDRAKSARRKREIYVGQWLPEPVADADPLLTTQRPDHAAESADSVSTAFLLALERLTAPERAALLLHDVFDFSFEEVAAMLARTPQGCRQLASRARKRVREARPNPPAPPREAERLTKALLAVMQGGDLAGFAAMLAQDAVLVSDGGGMKAAAPNPILGAERVLRFLAGLAAKTGAPKPDDIRLVACNGAAAIALADPDGGFQLWTLEWNADGRLAAIFLQRNPDKLAVMRL